MASQFLSESKTEILTETVPCMYVEWKVRDIHLLLQDTDHRIHSPGFHFNDAAWYLRLTIHAPKHVPYDSECVTIAMHLVRNDAPSSALGVNYHIGIKTVSGNTYRSHRGCSSIISERYCWGTSNIIHKSHLVQDKARLVQNDVMRFFCYFWVEPEVSLHAFSSTDPLHNQSKMIARQISQNTGEISTEIETILCVEWKVEDIHLLSEDTTHTIQSSSFQFKDETWYLRAIIHDTEFKPYDPWRWKHVCGPIDLHLVRKDCTTPKLNVDGQIRINLVDTIFRSDNTNCVERNADSHVWTNLVSRLDERIIEAPNGEVTFICYFRLENCGNLNAVSTTKMSEGKVGEKSTAEFALSPPCPPVLTFGQQKPKINGKNGQELKNEDELEEECSKSEEECSDSKEDTQENHYRVVDLKQECQKHAGLEKLGKDFKNLFISGEDSDVTIKVKNQEFKAHKYILRARSTVFHSMFTHDMAEKNSGTVDIDDCDPDAFESFLLYLYSGNMENLSINTVFDVYKAADKYDAEELKLKCKEFMLSSLSVDTVCDVIEHALQYDEAELLKTTTEFFAKNLKNVFLTVKWQSFLKKNPVATNELLVKATNYYVLKE